MNTNDTVGSGLSKYALKYAARRRADNGAENPMPRPLSWDYHPKHECPVRTEKQDLGKILPHEKPEMIYKFRVPFRSV